MRIQDELRSVLDSLRQAKLTELWKESKQFMVVKVQNFKFRISDYGQKKIKCLFHSIKNMTIIKTCKYLDISNDNQKSLEL
jgi:hypothetical protein